MFGEEEPVLPDEREEGCPVKTDDNDGEDGNQAKDEAGLGPDDARDEGNPVETDDHNKESLSTLRLKNLSLYENKLKNLSLYENDS